MPSRLNIKKHGLNEFVSQLQELKQIVSRGIFKIGEILFYVKTNELYKDDYPTFNSFIAIPELSFSRTTAYKAMKLYEIFVEKFALQEEISDIDPDKLYKISGFVDNDNIEEWVEKARALSRSDLNAEINEFKGKPEPPTLTELISEYLTQYPSPFEGATELILSWEKWKQEKREEGR